MAATKQADVMDWIVEAINQFAAGGYQEVENSTATWLENQVDIDWHAGAIMMVKDKNGDCFRVNVVKVLK